MDNLFRESEPDYDWDSFMDFSSNNIDTFTANYDDTNCFPPSELSESTALYANAEQGKSNEQTRSAPAAYSVAADHTQTGLQASQAAKVWRIEFKR